MLELIEQRARLAEAGRRLREDPLRLPPDLLACFARATQLTERCAAWSESLGHMLEDAALTSQEVRECTSMLAEIQGTIAEAGAAASASDSLELLTRVTTGRDALIGKRIFVAEVRNALLGHGIAAPTKESVYFVDESNASALVNDLDRLMQDAEPGSSEEAGDWRAELLEDAARLAGWMEKTIVFNVLYPSQPELLAELRAKLAKIERSLVMPWLLHELESFEEIVASSHRALTSLVEDHKGKDTPIRLSGWILDKEEGQELRRLARFLGGETY